MFCQHHIIYCCFPWHVLHTLSLVASFDEQASRAVLDLEGDELEVLGRSINRLKWDRKRKKYVGETGNKARKKVKTESGTLIPASYKSNHYCQWRRKHKIEGVLAGEEEEKGSLSK